MPFFRRSTITTVPKEQIGAAGHEAAVIDEACTLPTLPAVVVDSLRRPGGPSRSVLQVALESDPALACEVKGAWRVGPLDRLLDIMPTEIVFERVVEVACLRYAKDLGRPLGLESRGHRWRHAVAVAGASRALAREAGGDSIEAQQAFITGAMHLIGVHALELYARNHRPRAADRLARGEQGIAVYADSVGCCPWRVGGALLAARGLPDSVWQAVACQGRRGGAPGRARLCQARRCAHLAGYPPVLGDAPTQPAPALGVTAAQDAVRHMVRLRDARRV